MEIRGYSLWARYHWIFSFQWEANFGTLRKLLIGSHAVYFLIKSNAYIIFSPLLKSKTLKYVSSHSHHSGLRISLYLVSQGLDFISSLSKQKLFSLNNRKALSLIRERWRSQSQREKLKAGNFIHIIHSHQENLKSKTTSGIPYIKE